ncbi:phosphoenolpyruvate synthase [Streptococcus moroccensis]|uniref:Pyruvate,water dikinase n=1 Tax=Streptococcus moroccensis TaxID=1451356 RepID=A0ABT9YRP8_9STRE|nr:phosphoenolpyruvate synthase [Streptococcus moroccensis]MDQ0222394.1 pyruvate,water dikinase [Streptococcus moroccensis]
MKPISPITAKKAGAKAYHLDRLREAGLPVPPFEVYSYDLFDLPENRSTLKNFQEAYTNGLYTIEGLSQTLKTWARQQFPLEELSTVKEMIEPSTALFSVRSSATIEDSAQSSFAGQFHTSLYQHPSDLQSALLETLLSLYEVSALAYAFEQGLQVADLEMVALVQEMAVGQLSGIYFTANPQGLISEHVIVVGEGDGSQVVEDRIETTMTVYHPLDDLSYTQGLPLLNASQLSSLRGAARSCISLFGPYLDIEFTFVEDHLYLLQVRPITTLPDGQPLILDNSNIVESYPGLSTPLTISFVKEAYTSIFRSLATRLLGGNQVALEAYEPTFQQMVTAVNSRLYYQISSWYQLLQILPFSKQIIPIWQDMLGIEDKTYSAIPIKLGFWQRVKTSGQIMKQFLSTPKQMADLEKDFAEIERYFWQQITKDQSPQALYNLFEELKTQVLDHWDITLINDLYAFIYTGLLKKYRPSEDVQATIAGISQIESMKPAHAMQALTAQFQQLPRSQQDRLLQFTKEELQEWLGSTASLAQEMATFIQLYGDRAPEELKMETATFRTNPERLVAHLAQQHSQDVQSAFPQTPPQKAGFIQEQAIQGIRNRESSRLNRTRIYGMMREIFLNIGKDLVHNGKLDQLEDCFYLTYPELFDLALGKSQSMTDIIAQRRFKYQQDAKLPTFSRLVYLGEAFDRQVTESTETGQTFAQTRFVQGIGCAKGKVKGQIKVVKDVTQVGPLSDHIIVTQMTDPGWVYLLSQSKGIIAEKGSLLSHTAIISRELGIPSVVGVKHATELFQDGDWVIMDGLTGQIERLEGDQDD